MRSYPLVSLLSILLLLTFALPGISYSQSDKLIVEEAYSSGSFPLVSLQEASAIFVEDTDFEVVKIAAEDLRADIERVSGRVPELVHTMATTGKNLVIIGSIERCGMLKELSQKGKLDVAGLNGQWESFKIVVIENPFRGVEKALVIVGSDRRGTAFGIYELSRLIGVSPWYWWADVPVGKKETMFIRSGAYSMGPPDVKYRGMFINDERFGLKKWAAKKMDPEAGGLGLNTYRRVFELMLRLKSNYIWQPGNLALAELADDYAIVLGSPHNRQMQAAGWDEETQGIWQYDLNKEAIYEFWNSAVEERKKYENVFTIGMRGIKDLPMKGEKTVDEKVELLEEIIDDQREILSNHMARKIDEIPQIFVPYKEVLDLYNQGLELPDDICIVWPDDNYGYIKRLSGPAEQKRGGGAGVYYHLSYLGRPHDYLWLSTTNPVLVWTELKKAWDFHARDLWVFNVGDIKPAEYTFSFAMDLAWDISRFDRTNIKDHLVHWMGETFGMPYAVEIGDVMYEFYRLAFQRKPEFMGWDRLEPTTPVVDTEYSLIHYREAENRLNASKAIKEKAESLLAELPEDKKAAFFQLVYYPVACSYFTDAKLLLAQKNRLYARQQRASTNSYAKLAASFQDSIQMATQDYHQLLDGKWEEVIQWDGIGINIPEYWMTPTEKDTVFIRNAPNYFMPPLQQYDPSEEASMGIFTEGYESRVLIDGHPKLPWFSSVSKKSYFFEIYNKGQDAFAYTIRPSHDWIRLSKVSGSCKTEERIQVDIDYDHLSAQDSGEIFSGFIEIDGGNHTEKIDVFVFLADKEAESELENRFVEDNGSIAIPAENFHRKSDGPGYGWELTEDLGVTGMALGVYPFTAEPVEHEWDMEEKSAWAEYDFYCYNSGWVDLYSLSLPTHPINSQRHCLYGISIDDSPPAIVDFQTKWRSEKWKQNVQRNSAVEKTRHYIDKPGPHTLRIWMIDTGVFLDKLIIDFGGKQDSYLGPDSFHPSFE